MMNSKEILLKLTELFGFYLEELSKIKPTDFIEGEMTAYLECLEIISLWDKSDIPKNLAQKYNLNLKH